MRAVDIPNDPGVLTAKDWSPRVPYVRHLNVVTTEARDEHTATVRVAANLTHLGESPWLMHSVSRLVDLARLEPDWDGCGSRPVDRGIVQDCLDLLSQVASLDTPPPSIVPLRDGGIQVEWHQNSMDIEISLPGGPEPRTCFAEDLESGEVWEDIPVDPSNLGEVKGIISLLTDRPPAAEKR